MIQRLLRRALPVLILALGAFLFWMLLATRPEVERREAPVPLLKVEVVRLEPTDYAVTIDSQGVVSARTESTLIPEVSGKILRVSPDFRDGGFFKEGDVLLEIDPSDYRTAVTIAEANLAQARLQLAEEEAASRQAERDWERLGMGEGPSNLVLRQPQLAVARANVAAAEARLEQARRDLERTRITAPYDGRVLNQLADVGQVVNQGNALAEVYAVDYAEIRLPLTSEEYAILGMPALTRGESPDSIRVPVRLHADFGPERVSWEGTLVRVEGAVDTRSRQIYVVAQVDDPYGPRHAQPLKVGLFVEARIRGATLEDVYVLPRPALREGRFVLTLDADNRIGRVEAPLIWSNAREIVFRQPEIAPGTLVSLTQMALAIDGMEVVPLVDGKPLGPDKGPGLAGKPTAPAP